MKKYFFKNYIFIKYHVYVYIKEVLKKTVKIKHCRMVNKVVITFYNESCLKMIVLLPVPFEFDQE